MTRLLLVWILLLFLNPQGDTTGVRSELPRDIRAVETFVDDFNAQIAALAAGATDSKATARAIMDLAWTARLSGDQRTAEEAVLLALAALGDTSDPLLLAEAHYLRGVIARHATRFEEAWGHFETALGLLDPADRSHRGLIASVTKAQGNWLRYEDMDDALAHYRESLRLRRDLGDRSPLLADHLVWLGWTLLHSGHPQEATLLFAEARTLLTDLGMTGHSLMGVLENALGEIAFLNEDWARAESHLTRAATIFMETRAELFPGYPRRQLPLDVFHLLAAVQLEQGRFDDAWSSIQRAKGVLSTEFIHLADWKQQAPESYPRYRALQQAVLETRIDPETARQAPTPEHLRRWVRHLGYRAELQTLQKTYLDNTPAPPDVDALRRALPEGGAYVGWIDIDVAMAHARTAGPAVRIGWAYVVRKDDDRVTWVPLWRGRNAEDFTDLEEAIGGNARLTRNAGETLMRIAQDPLFHAQRRTLGRYFVDPLLSTLDGVHTLVVDIPFRRCLPMESMVLADGSFVGDRFAVCYAPSTTAYVALSGREPATETDFAALIVGAPEYGGPAAVSSGRIEPVLLRRAVSGDRAALDRLPNLPFAERESRSIAATLENATLLVREQATEKRFMDLASSGDLGHYGVVHFASHALVAAHPEQSAIALSRPTAQPLDGNDGLLDTEELLALDLDTDLLVLSGCQTGRGGDLGPGVFLGLVQALWGAGARSIVSSLWKVDDAATALLMERFYANLGEGQGKAQALAEAKAWLRGYRTEDGEQPFAHPIYWSGFVLAGLPS